MMPHHVMRAETLSKFVQIASEIREKWLPYEDVLPWFRGQESADWGLVPKFYRSEPTEYSSGEPISPR